MSALSVADYVQVDASSFRPTLFGLRERYPHLFYRQDWFNSEPFMAIPLPAHARVFPPVAVMHLDPPEPRTSSLLPHAVTLAAQYVIDPTNPIWRQHYFWTCDLDRQGQRVYVGDNGKGFEIHRHLHLTERFGVAIWQ